MAVQINTYAGLKAGVLAWLARTGDALLDARFDDFLLNAERRIYYGHAMAQPDNPLRSDPLRILEMEAVDPAFGLGLLPAKSIADIQGSPRRMVVPSHGYGVGDRFYVTGVLGMVQVNGQVFSVTAVVGPDSFDFSGSSAGYDPYVSGGTTQKLSAAVPQPAGFLDLISATLNSPEMPLQIVSQVTLDSYAGRTLGSACLIAVSGTNFRVKDDPGLTFGTLRYYRKLATPSGSASNAILENYPDVYLYACLVEAAIFTQDEAGALRYVGLYNTAVGGLNARTLGVTGAASPAIRTAERPTP